MIKSFKEYLSVVSKYWWTLVIVIIFTAVGVISLFIPNFLVPYWVGIMIALIFLVFAQFLAFHKIRIERDDARKGVESIIKKLKKYKISINKSEKDASHVLFEYGNQLVSVIFQENVPLILGPVFAYLGFLNIISSRMSRVQEGYDKTEWVLTDMGKLIIEHLRTESK